MSENKTEIVISAVNKAEQAFKQIDSQFANLKKNAENVGGRLQKLSGGFAALGVSLSASAFAAWIKGAIAAADEMGKMSQKVGISVENLSALKYAGELADVGLEQLGIGMKQLSKNILEANAGGKDQQAIFAALDISNKELTDASKDSYQVLLKLADQFAAMPDSATKTALAMKLFGKSGADLIPLLNAGGQGIADMRVEGERFHQVISTEAAKSAEDFNDNLRRLELSATGFANVMAAGVLPTLEEFSAKFVDMQINVDSSDWDKNWTKSLGLETMLEDVKTLLTGIRPEARAIMREREQQERVLAGIHSATEEETTKVPKKPDTAVFDRYLQRLKELSKNSNAAASQIGALNKSIEDQTARLSLNELELVDRQAEVWLKDGADRIKVEKWVAAEKDKIITDSMRKAFAAMEQGNAKLADIEQQRAKDSAEWISNQINTYADGIAKMLKEMDQRQELGIRGKIYDTDTRRQFFIGSEQENIEDQVKNYRELLALKLKDVELYGDTMDVAGWEAQQQAIADTRRELLGLNKELQKYTGGTAEAFGEGINQYLRDMPTQFESVRDLAVDALQGTEDALVDFVKNGKLDFQDLIDSMIEDLARLAIQQTLMKPLGDWFSSLFSGSGVDIDNWGGLSGGLLGSYATGTDYVPRTGPYLLHQGEKVIPSGGSAPAYSVSVTNNLDGFNRLSSELRNEVEDLVVKILRKHS